MRKFNSPCFLGTIALLTFVSGYTSAQLAQGIVAKSSQKLATSIEPAQATLVNSSQANTCLNSQTNQSKDCPHFVTLKNEQHLDEVYQQLVSQLGGASREKLINSQLAWETFAEAQCGFETRGFDSSTSPSSVYIGCLEGMTQQRIQDLKRHLTSSQ